MSETRPLSAVQCLTNDAGVVGCCLVRQRDKNLTYYYYGGGRYW